jgi:hypothetical protein
MTDRRYYSERHGRGPGAAALALEDLKRAAKAYFGQLETEGHFQEYLGYECVDKGFVPGLVGTDAQTEVLLTLRRPNLWPIQSSIDGWSEDDLFDMVEFLYAHTSEPTERHFHSYYGCGWHCTEFDHKAGQAEYRDKINRLLRAYDTGFELSKQGEVLAIPPTGLEPLLDTPLPHPDVNNVTARVDAALQKFRHHRASIQNRRDAVRDLADVLEFLRPKLRTVLVSQDENDLFNIANNFGIRHHRSGQKTEYDQTIWLSWMFYYYLATIHTVVQLLEKKPGGP